jgi:IstB-like ATP binding protein
VVFPRREPSIAEYNPGRTPPDFAAIHGVGKSFVACALAQKACRDGYSALYTGAVALFRDLAIARADGSLRSLLARLSRLDVLVIDDWAMAPLAETERRDFWEICEDRYQTRSTILTSQLPVARWHEQIGDPTAADGILDRLVHNAHRIEMRGDSMRKKRLTPRDAMPCAQTDPTPAVSDSRHSRRVRVVYRFKLTCSIEVAEY